MLGIFRSRRVSIFVLFTVLVMVAVTEASMPQTPPGAWTAAEWLELTDQEQHAFILGAIHMVLNLSMAFISEADQRQQLLDEIALGWDPDSVSAIVAALNEHIETRGGEGHLFDLLDECCSGLWQ